MSVQRHNTILSINIDRQLNLLSELSETIEQTSPIILAIQDPPTLTESQRNIVLNNFFPTMTISSFNKRHLILTNKDLLIGIPDKSSDDTNDKASSLSIEFKLMNNDDSYLLTSIYLKPKADHNDIQNCLGKIETLARDTSGLSRTIILGDTNSTSNLWAPITELVPELEGLINFNHDNNNTYQQKRINRGHQLNRFINRTKLTCLNAAQISPTFTSNSKQGNRRAYIDLILVGNKAIYTWNNFATYKHSKYILM